MNELNSKNESEIPWYHAGLKFACTQCGNCCTGSSGYVWVTPEDISNIANYLNKPIGEVRLFHTRYAKGKTSLTEYQNGDCVYFDPQLRRCKVYPVRPIQCRTWPFWGKHLESPESWQNLKPHCPGIDTGELVQLEQINKQVEMTDL